MNHFEFQEKSSGYIAYYAEYNWITGSSDASILLCNMLRWNGRGGRSDGFFYKSSDELLRETGLSYYQQKKARNRLIALGVLEEFNEWIERRIYFHVNTKVLDRMLDEHYEAYGMNPPPSMRSGKKIDGSDNSETEETSRDIRRNLNLENEETSTSKTEETSISYTTRPTRLQQDNNHGGGGGDVSVRKKPKAGSKKAEEVMNLWNSMVKDSPLHEVHSIHGKRLASLSARVRENKDFDAMFFASLKFMLSDPFYRGENDRGWTGNFDYILQPGKLVSLYERAMAAKKSGPSSNKPYSAPKDSELSPEMKKAMADLRAEREQLRKG